MAIQSGTHLGPYEILSAIGAGGMGEVYRARDPKLGRDVAIKVLPDAFARDAERMARFQREAKVLASLDHPNIASIYGLEDSSGTYALVMQLVEGPTLADRIKQGPIPIDEALPIAKQICDALEYAHERGIIHRDLKPANVKVTNDDVVKVLDFGLAKALEGDPSSIDISTSPTISRMATMQGVLLGTAAYMSPEQAKGKTVDRRADIWSFGCVLYEMLTGKVAFHGESVTDTLAAVIRAEPDWSLLPAATLMRVRVLLQRCLQKDPKQRLRDIGDARISLDEVLSGGPEAPVSTPIPVSTPLWRRMLPWVLTAMLGLVALWQSYISYRTPNQDSTRLLEFSVLPPEGMSFGPSIPAVSPDGSRIAFNVDAGGRLSLWIRDLNSMAARQLEGTDGALMPFWSPDSRSVAFFADGEMKKINAMGGPAMTVCNCSQVLGGVGGAWGKDGVILFTPSLGGLFRVSANGGTPVAVTERDSALQIFDGGPSFLPDGRHFVYTSIREPNATTSYIGDLDSKARRQILTGNTNVVYADPGYLLFALDQTLMVQRFNPATGQKNGDPMPVGGFVEHARTNFAQFSASQNGVLVYRSTGRGGNAQLTWFDRSGKPTGTMGTPGLIFRGVVSPDGKTVAFDRYDLQTGRDIWLHDIERNGDSRFTLDGLGFDPVWSGDSSTIAFASTRNGGIGLYRKTIGSTQDQPLDVSANIKFADDWSRDGRYLIEEVPAVPPAGSQIWVLPFSGDRRPFRLLNSAFNQSQAKLSPNGRWLAYVSDESKRSEIYVVSFPTPENRWQISTNGGDRPVWSRDGAELFFISSDQKMMSVAMKYNADNAAKLSYGIPQRLFSTDIPADATFDVNKDGRFLIPVPVGQTSSATINVIVNWQAALKK